MRQLTLPSSVASKPLGGFRYTQLINLVVLFLSGLHEITMKRCNKKGVANVDSPMHIIFGPRKVMRQIDDYAKWKGLRFSGAASTHKRELRNFVKKSKICCLEEITLLKVNAYLTTINSIALRSIALRSLQGFLQYCKLMGYIDIRFTSLTTTGTISQMTAVHPLLRVDKVKRAKELRAYKINGKPMSYRAIKAKMETEDNARYDVHAIFRWVNYPLKDLSTG